MDGGARVADDVALPVCEGEVCECDAVAGGGGLGRPFAVYVEGVGVAVADKVVEGAVGDGAVAAVVFDLFWSGERWLVVVVWV